MPNIDNKHNTIRFTFTGTPIIVKKTFLTEGETKNGNKTLRINFGIKADSNVEFAGLFAVRYDPIRVFDGDNNAMDVPWENREDPTVIEKVPSRNLYRTNIGGEPGAPAKCFISSYDFVEYLSNMLPDCKDDLTVTGRMIVRYDNKGVLRRNYNIESVWLRKEKEIAHLAVDIPLYYWKDCVDKSDLKKEGKVYVNGYVKQRVNEVGKSSENKFFPLTMTFNTNIFNLEKPDHKAKYELRMKRIDTKAKNPEVLMWHARIVNGAPEVEFDESQLGELQRELIAAGEKTLEDFRPNATIRGEHIEEIRFFEPEANGEWGDGAVDSGYTVSEFEDLIYVPVKDETVEEMEKVVEKPKKEEHENPIGVDDPEEMF